MLRKLLIHFSISRQSSNTEGLNTRLSRQRVYFNAEEHEEKRFMDALGAYKKENITVAKSLAVLNIT